MKTEALVLERQGEIALREIDLPDTLGAGQVRIDVHTVGICGSDVHYYTHGRIGRFVVDGPMVLGHEASGTVAEIGSAVTTLAVGDRVCMEPGIPDSASRAARLGLYNVDPAVVFWATPPVHGVLTRSIVHPAAFTYKLPDRVSFAEAAMVEPFAVGLHAAVKARIKPGDRAVVIGAGPIGVMTALAALASGCAAVTITDLVDEKLAVAAAYPGIRAVNVRTEDLPAIVAADTRGWGCEIVFEASGAAAAYRGIDQLLAPGGCLVVIGMPTGPVSIDMSSMASKEIRIETIFRYANVFDRALELIASGKVDLKPLVSGTFPFADGVSAFERAAEARPGDVKLQIALR